MTGPQIAKSPIIACPEGNRETDRDSHRGFRRPGCGPGWCPLGDGGRRERWPPCRPDPVLWGGGARRRRALRGGDLGRPRHLPPGHPPRYHGGHVRRSHEEVRRGHASGRPALHRQRPGEERDPRRRRRVGLPVSNLATQELGRTIVANLVMLGVVVAKTGIVSISGMEAAIRENVPPKTIDLNLKAFRKGLELGGRPH